MALERLIFYTYPDRWIRADRPLRQEPYDRVVGVTLGSTVLWAHNRNMPRELHYNWANTNPEVFKVNGYFALIALKYFGRYMHDQPSSDDPFNCHHFAAHFHPELQLDHELQLPEGHAHPDLETDHELPFGAHAVFGSHEQERVPLGITALHSAVSIVKNRMLQVVGNGGPMALDTAEKIRDHYTKRYAPTNLYDPGNYLSNVA